MVAKKLSLSFAIAFGVSTILFAAAPTQAEEELNPGGTSLLKKVPADAAFVVSAQVEDILELPLVQEKLETSDDEDLVQMQEKLAEYGIKFENLCKECVLFGDSALVMASQQAEGEDIREIDKGYGALIARTAVTEEDFRDVLDKGAADNNFTYETEDMQSHNVYVLTEKTEEANQDSNNSSTETTALTYLEADRLLVSTKSHMGSVLEKMGSNGSILDSAFPALSDVEQDSLLWLAFDMSTIPLGENMGEDSKQKQIAEDIVGFNLALNVSGEEEQTFDLRGFLETASLDTADTLYQRALQFSGMIPMIFQNDPQLGNQVKDAVDIQKNNKEITLSVSLEKELTEKLSQYAEQAASDKNTEE